MEEIEFTWARFAKMAWLFCWRLVALGFFVGAAAFDLLRWSLKALTGSEGPPGISAVVLIPIVLLCLRMMLRKHYQDFRIALISTRRPTAHLSCRIPDKANEK